ncbi:hypothetical protein LY76DRAFT_58396 [Colletotrichum caudatum]|nr:hypothetical protein LY76DRAFT_58396 [Colletotrichum caudatum]
MGSCRFYAALRRTLTLLRGDIPAVSCFRVWCKMWCAVSGLRIVYAIGIVGGMDGWFVYSRLMN